MNRPANPPDDSPAPGLQAGVQSIAEDAQQKAVQAVDQVREHGKSQLADQKDRVAATVGSVASALKETSKQLQQGDDAHVAEYVDRLAHNVEKLSGHLREHDVDELIADTESFARRQPALFLSGAFFIGIVAARFLKSSKPTPSPKPYASGSSLNVPPRSTASGPAGWQGGSAASRPAQLPPSPRLPTDSPRPMNTMPPASLGSRSSE